MEATCGSSAASGGGDDMRGVCIRVDDVLRMVSLDVSIFYRSGLVHVVECVSAFLVDTDVCSPQSP